MIAGLRGPRTAALLGVNHPVPLGDPGLLCASILGVSRRPSNGRIAFIPHYVDHDRAQSMLYRSTFLQQQCDLVPIKQAPRTFLQQLSNYEACISSALHGVIAADSLGIPVVPLNIRGKLDGQDFKFHDYYEGTGRKLGGLATVEEAISILEGAELEEHVADLNPLNEMMTRAAVSLGVPARLSR